MAVGDFFGGLKNKVRTVYNNFFYNGGEAPSPRMQEEYEGAQEQPYAAPAGQWQQPQYYGAQPPQQPVYQQPAYQQPTYQQPAAGYQQPVYQQPQASQQQPRGRRMQHRAAQQENNVVDFGAYQQNQGQAAQALQAAPMGQTPQGAPAGNQPAAQESGASLLSARVINARSMGDCRSAITLLRNGDAVVIVLESITDPMEMRRLVDTLSGACYSLTATITKVSRYGVYLLAPQTLAVYTDQTTNMMNSAPGRAQARAYQPGYTGQRAVYTTQPMQQPQPQTHAPAQSQNPYAAPQQGFTQRMASQEESTQSFYQRPAPQMAQTPSFSAQVAGYGYAPDEAVASDQ